MHYEEKTGKQHLFRFTSFSQDYKMKIKFFFIPLKFLLGLNSDRKAALFTQVLSERIS